MSLNFFILRNILYSTFRMKLFKKIKQYVSLIILIEDIYLILNIAVKKSLKL